ncbi:hypothetical protein CTRI78_v009761 [Colletotrichum trifolii]|uniref:Nucleoside phosphorylase domain-containing protein n=1 Tax=Colletotrichum trifolii TaxID=5466 RepID=A0A4R8QRS1_COLTR|nr:hypothetical protein CTRI78_v009761 [Colletotrichum trifolii]
MSIYMANNAEDGATISQPHNAHEGDSRRMLLPSLHMATFDIDSSQEYRRYSISVAIICALPLETDACKALFDEHWDDLSTFDLPRKGDTNAYSFGRIGRHNVILIHMANMGTTTAAAAAAHCKASFPSVVLALLVGVCGGVPLNKETGVQDMVLGDVIISDGVVPYDFGRQYPDMVLRKSGVLEVMGRPPPAVGNLLAKLKSRSDRKSLNERVSHHLQHLRNDFGDAIVYPGADNDRLFESTYKHKHRISSNCPICNNSDGFICDTARTSSCEELGCDQNRLVPRRRLSGLSTDSACLQPIVHFGLVASGNSVMKSGEHRDRIAAREKVIAFEMEATGAWENFPCVVIKGVCDYADSHKHKTWQLYAAATAAACMKAFLEKWTYRT